MDPVHAAAFRLLISRIGTTVAGSLAMAAFMLVTLWPYVRPATMLAWCAVVCASMVARIVYAARFRALDPPDGNLPAWERVFVIGQLVIGLCWGSSASLFARTDQPLSVLFTLLALGAGAAGGVAGQAASPAGFRMLIGGMLGVPAARFVSLGGVEWTLLALALLFYAVTLFGYNRLESRIVLDSFRMRFENEALVEALRLRTEEAEGTRRAAEAASLAKSQFLAAASHDLRQPLYALGLFSASLKGLTLDVEAQRVVARIGESIAAMERLFAGLLDLSRLQAGVVRAEVQPVSVDALFDGLARVFSAIAAELGLELRFRSDGEWVRTDPVLLDQLLGNLVANAIRYTDEGAVLVAARARGNAVRLEVWDTGVGIAAGDRGRVWDEFVQLGNPERDRTKGLGLGLSIVRRAAALLGAEVSLSSRPGGGSRFTMVQPACAPAAASMPAVEPSAALVAKRPGRVLVVDDEAPVREALLMLLRGWGVDAVGAVDGARALALVEAGERFDRLLCDQRLPGDADGLLVVETLRRAHPAPPPDAMLVTGDVDPTLLARARIAAVPLLQKPVSEVELRRVLGLLPSPTLCADPLKIAYSAAAWPAS